MAGELCPPFADEEVNDPKRNPGVSSGISSPCCAAVPGCMDGGPGLSFCVRGGCFRCPSSCSAPRVKDPNETGDSSSGGWVKNASMPRSNVTAYVSSSFSCFPLLCTFGDEGTAFFSLTEPLPTRSFDFPGSPRRLPFCWPPLVPLVVVLVFGSASFSGW